MAKITTPVINAGKYKGVPLNTKNHLVSASRIKNPKSCIKSPLFFNLLETFSVLIFNNSL